MWMTAPGQMSLPADSPMLVAALEAEGLTVAVG